MTDTSTPDTMSTPDTALAPQFAPASASAPAGTAAKQPLDASDPYRYGVYLRPDPRTCRAVTAVTDQLRAQYGLVSAGAFPPHATLVGSQPFGGDVTDVVDALTELLRDRPAFDVHNAGVRGQGIGYVYDVAETADGSVNQAFVQLARDVDAAVAPFRRPMHSPLPNDYDPEHWRAHLSLASHDLYGRPDLRDEVGAFIRDLDVPVPDGFRGDTVVLYRTASPDWSGRWWHAMTWEHVRTWTLSGA